MPSPTPAPARAARRRGRAAAAVGAVGVLLALTGCSALEGVLSGGEPVRDDATGQIVEAAEASAFQIRVGDCMNSGPEAQSEETFEVETVPTVPCSEPHDSEIYASHQLPDGDYPGDDAVALAGDEVCYEEFTGFVGKTWDESVLEYTMFFPTQESWESMDDREVLCIVLDPSGDVTGSLKGAAR